MITFCTFFGIACGLSYTVPLKIAWDHYPEKKGLISGIVLAGFGVGSFIFNIVSTLIVNPKNLDTGKNGFYPQSVSKHVPSMITKISIIWSILIVISVYLIKPLKKQEEALFKPKDLKSS